MGFKSKFKKVIAPVNAPIQATTNKASGTIGNTVGQGTWDTVKPIGGAIVGGTAAGAVANIAKYYQGGQGAGQVSSVVGAQQATDNAGVIGTATGYSKVDKGLDAAGNARQEDLAVADQAAFDKQQADLVSQEQARIAEETRLREDAAAKTRDRLARNGRKGSIRTGGLGLPGGGFATRELLGG